MTRVGYGWSKQKVSIWLLNQTWVMVGLAESERHLIVRYRGRYRLWRRHCKVWPLQEGCRTHGRYVGMCEDVIHMCRCKRRTIF